MAPFDLAYQSSHDPLLVGTADRHHLFVQSGRPAVHLPFDERAVRYDLLRVLQQFELPVQVDKEIRRNIFPRLSGQELPEVGNRPYRYLFARRKFGNCRIVVFDQQKNTLRHGISHIAPANRPVDAGRNERAQGFFKKRCALTFFRHRYQLGKIFFKYFSQLRNVVR